MLVFRILATVFLGISCLTDFFKNVGLFADNPNEIRNVCIWTIYGWLWRAFCRVAIWLI